MHDVIWSRAPSLTAQKGFAYGSLVIGHSCTSRVHLCALTLYWFTFKMAAGWRHCTKSILHSSISAGSRTRRVNPLLNLHIFYYSLIRAQSPNSCIRLIYYLHCHRTTDATWQFLWSPKGMKSGLFWNRSTPSQWTKKHHQEKFSSIINKLWANFKRHT